jgi:hypothetical protein
MAALCLQPSGYRVYFDYNGDLASAPLLQDMDTATWVVDGTVIARNIAFPIEGPTWTRPKATRTRVGGGNVNHDMMNISGHSVLGTSRYHRKLVTFLEEIGGGDCYYYAFQGGVGHHMWFQGAVDDLWREHCSTIGDIRYAVGDVGSWDVVPFVDLSDPASDEYHIGMDRHVVQVTLYGPLLPVNEVDAEFDVHSHKLETVRPKVWAQAWDDALISIWGEIRQEVQSPLAQLWDVANDIATREQVIGTLSAIPVGVKLGRLDLRWEAGDYLTIENDRGSDFNMWVESVSYGV